MIRFAEWGVPGIGHKDVTGAGFAPAPTRSGEVMTGAEYVSGRASILVRLVHLFRRARS